MHRYADIALVIGKKKYRNGAIAIETMSLLLDIAFNRLNLQNVKASHVSANSSSSVLLKLFDFLEVGRFRKISYIRGEYVDSVISQLSREDWTSRNRR